MDKTFNVITPYEIYLELKRRAFRESTPEINYYTICGSLGNGEEMYLLNCADKYEIKRVNLTETEIKEMLKVMTKEQIIDEWFNKIKGENNG